MKPDKRVPAGLWKRTCDTMRNDGHWRIWPELQACPDIVDGDATLAALNECRELDVSIELFPDGSATVRLPPWRQGACRDWTGNEPMAALSNYKAAQAPKRTEFAEDEFIADPGPAFRVAEKKGRATIVRDGKPVAFISIPQDTLGLDEDDEAAQAPKVEDGWYWARSQSFGKFMPIKFTNGVSDRLGLPPSEFDIRDRLPDRPEGDE